MSGIYIPGVEMPRCCMDCHYHISLRDQCILTHRDQRDLWSRPDWCPIVPVPPHGDLADIDAYRDEFMNGVYALCCDDPDNYRANAIIDLYDNAPTIIPAEGGET